jgi:outer membrane protein with beta-barrel domain
MRRTITSVLLTLLTAVATAYAQEPPPGLVEVREGSRRGFWLGLSVGVGGESYDVTNGPGYSSPYYQPTISLRAGGTVGSHLRLGGEVLSWIDDQGDRTRSLTSALFVSQFYPIRAAGLYLKGGLGIGRSAVSFDDGFDVGDTGFAGLVGAGYELHVARGIYLNPAVDLVGHTYNSRTGGSYRERMINFGLGVLFQTSR